MIENKKYFIIPLFIIFILAFTFLSSFSSVKAVRHIDEQYDYLYSYEPFIDDNVQALVDKALKDDRVSSGDFYYFVAYNYGDRCFNCFLFRKSAIKDNTLYLLFNGWGEYSSVYNSDTECFDIKFPDDFDGNSDNFVRLSGRNCWDNEKKYFNITGLPDIDNKRYRFPFATNFDGKIVRQCSNGEEKNFFFQTQTTIPILEQVEELPKMVKEIMMKIIPVGLVVLSIFLVIFLIRYVILRLM